MLQSVSKGQCAEDATTRSKEGKCCPVLLKDSKRGSMKLLSASQQRHPCHAHARILWQRRLGD